MSMWLRASGSQLGSTAALLTCCSICLFLHPLPNCSITQNQKCGVLCGGAGILAMPRKCTKTLPAIWSRLPSTSTSGSVYMNAYYLCVCVCDCHAVWSQLSFRFHLAWSCLLEDHDLWFATYSGHFHPASFYLVAHTSFLGMFAGILHVNPLKLASLHLTVRPICGKLFT